MSDISDDELVKADQDQELSDISDGEDDLVIPKHILEQLTPDELILVKENLAVIENAANSSPIQDDAFLKSNPGILPVWVAELLTQDERRAVIEGVVNQWSTELHFKLANLNKKKFQLSLDLTVVEGISTF